MDGLRSLQYTLFMGKFIASLTSRSSMSQNSGSGHTRCIEAGFGVEKVIASPASSVPPVVFFRLPSPPSNRRERALTRPRQDQK